jgi:hypothetical protein
MTVNNTAIQMVITDDVRGRVMSVMMMTFGLMPLGAVPAGIAAQSVGAPPVVAVCALLFIVSTLAIVALVPSLRAIDSSLEEGRDRETARRASPARCVAARLTSPAQGGCPARSDEPSARRRMRSRVQGQARPVRPHTCRHSSLC